LDGYALLFTDIQFIRQRLPQFCEENIKRYFIANEDVYATTKEGLLECMLGFETIESDLGDLIVQELTNKCIEKFRLPLRKIPENYRLTNKPKPTKPSQYTSSIFVPLSTFYEQHKEDVITKASPQWNSRIISELAKTFEDLTKKLLSEVQQMEQSLKSLSNKANASGLTNICVQLTLDIDDIANQVQNFSVQNKDSREFFKEIYVEVNNAMTKVEQVSDKSNK